MARHERFTFLCNPDERLLIEKLAHRLQRSQSDAVRYVVINAAQTLGALDHMESKQLTAKETKSDLFQ